MEALQQNLEATSEGVRLRAACALLDSFASKVAEACHPESFGSAQDKFHQGSGVVATGLLRGAQPQIPRRSAPRNDRFEARLS